MIFGTIADIGFAFVEGDVFVDKIPVDPIIFYDFVTDGVGHGQVGLGVKQNGAVGALTGAGGAGGSICSRVTSIFKKGSSRLGKFFSVESGSFLMPSHFDESITLGLRVKSSLFCVSAKSEKFSSVV